MDEPKADDQPRILTNMCFWQSAVWTRAVSSIYPHTEQRDPDLLPWWKEAIELWKRARACDVVVTQGARESLAYGLLCLATGRPSRQVLCEVFIDSAREGSLAWNVKTRLFRRIARRALGVLTNSSAEIDSIADRFALSQSKLRFVPLPSTIHDPAASATDAGFILSAGRSHRDYPLLLRIAEDCGLPIHIVCGDDDLLNVPLSPSVTVLRELDRHAYLEQLRSCSFVVIPLVPRERSTGQVVALEAMAVGKAVICTRVPGTIDYVEHDRNGLLVPPGDAPALLASIRRLSTDPALRTRLTAEGLRDVQSKYSIEGHARRKLEAITELWRNRS